MIIPDKRDNNAGGRDDEVPGARAPGPWSGSVTFSRDAARSSSRARGGRTVPSRSPGHVRVGWLTWGRGVATGEVAVLTVAGLDGKWGK